MTLGAALIANDVVGAMPLLHQGVSDKVHYHMVSYFVFTHPI